MGRVLTYEPAYPTGRKISYEYDNLGNKTHMKLTNTSGEVIYLDVYYNYGSIGWLSQVLLNNREVGQGGQLVAEYQYVYNDDPAGKVGSPTQIDCGNDTYQTYRYDTDPRYRLEYIRYAYKCTDDDDVEIRGGIHQLKDPMGNPAYYNGIDAQNNVVYSRDYDYDENNRLSQVDLVSQTYDWVGNRINPGGFEYNNDADQLTDSVAYGTSHDYTYDYRGNLTFDNYQTGSDKTYTYTHPGLLYTVVGSGTSTMTWDAERNRVELQTSGSQTYNYIYDPTARIPAVIEEIHNGSSVFYVRDPSGALIARISGDQIRYYHFDELGSTLFLTGRSGTITDKYTYDAWGNVTSHEGSTGQPYQYVGQLGYYTHYQDTNTAHLVQLGVRFYEPAVGRFTQRDPVKDGLNWYLYAGSNPAYGVDPTGLAKWYQKDILGPVYFHAWLEFEKITCFDEKSAGFWPNQEKNYIGAVLFSRHGYISIPDDYEGRRDNVSVVKRNSSRDFECALCLCIEESLKDPPAFSIFLHVCGSWARSMWDCANVKIHQRKKFGICFPCKNKMP